MGEIRLSSGRQHSLLFIITEATEGTEGRGVTTYDCLCQLNTRILRALRALRGLRVIIPGRQRFTVTLMVDKPRILIIYTSMSGNTEALARAIADGAIHGQNVEVEIKRAREVGPQDIERASALAFGSPTYYSYMSGEMKSLFDGALSFKGHFEGKPAIAFGTGNGGQLKCIESIENILSFFGVRFVQKSDILSAGLAVQGTPDEGAKVPGGSGGKKPVGSGHQACMRESEAGKGAHHRGTYRTQGRKSVTGAISNILRPFLHAVHTHARANEQVIILEHVRQSSLFP